MISPRKISSLVFCLVFVASALAPAFVSAGVVKKLVEVDAAERMRLEQERIAMQEEYEREAKEAAEQRKLAEEKGIADKRLEIAKKLREDELSELDAAHKRLAADLSPQKKSKSHDFNWLSILGPVVGVPVGMIAGFVRGGSAKGVEYANDFADMDGLGSNIPGKAFATISGFSVGAVAGSVTGILKGAVDGVRLGISDPFSLESVSLAGDFLDFHPFKIVE